MDDVTALLKRWSSDERPHARYFGGLSLEESADVLLISKTSAWRDWQMARAWRYDALADGVPEPR